MNHIDKYIKKLESGVSLPIAILFSFICSGVLFSYINNIYERDWQVDFKIAQTKAMYNAESGIALGPYNKLFKKEYEPNPTLDTIPRNHINNMGYYSVGWGEMTDTITWQIGRYANSMGYATIKHLLGNKEIEIERNKKLTLGRDDFLSEYLYLTNNENAGGAPWCFDSTPSENSRRDVTFGTSDVINPEWPSASNADPICDVRFQSNDNITMSNFGEPPVFNMTVTVTIDENGEVNSPNIGSHNFDSIFQGDPQLDTLECIKLPPNGYEENKDFIERSNRHFTFDATDKLKWNAAFTQRDTLIMTDIEFFTTPTQHGFKVKQWWFLQPPYFRKGLNYPYIFPNEYTYNLLLGNTNASSDYHLEYNGNDCEIGTGSNTTKDIKGCWTYIDQLEKFHSKTINTFNGQETTLDPQGIVAGRFGFHNYDFPEIYKEYDQIDAGSDLNNVTWVSQLNGYPNNVNFVDDNPPYNMEDQLLPEYNGFGGSRTYLYEHPVAIYVKGGPVRVHGKYKGRYTIYTDEYTLYHRHAHGLNTMGPNPVDTLWNHIWIIDDIVNVDASPHTYTNPVLGTQNNPESMFYAQPNEDDPDSGSENALGLVSGASVYIANSRFNGARDCNNNQNTNHDVCHININANIVAFNESFATHYSQNTYTESGQMYSNPPYGDGQGIDIFGGTTDDTRGIINLWGGVIQQYRGYVVRNAPGPYDLGFNDNLGYPTKNYNYDCNIKKNPPPIFPTIEPCFDEFDEDSWTVKGYY